MVKRTEVSRSFKKEPPKEPTEFNWDPKVNHDVISIVKQDDGNFKGFMYKNGKYIEVRQGDPNTVLQLLITHE